MKLMSKDFIVGTATKRSLELTMHEKAA